jgi:hypothetical protein
MVSQNYLTKFVLHTLQTKHAAQVAYHLKNIFLTFGVPCILFSDNGKEFANSVITELKQYWPELPTVHGKLTHSQSQGSGSGEHVGCLDER